MAVVTAVFTFLCAVVLQVGGLTCIDVVDNVQQNGNEIISPGRTVIVPRLNFTCNGEITNIRVRVSNRTSGTNFPYIQLWRESSTPQLYNLVGQVQIQSSHISSTGLTHQEANIVLTSIDRIQFLSGDVIGFYNPSDTGYVIDDIQTDGYVYYVFVGSSASSQNLNNGFTSNRRQPLIQFTIDAGPPTNVGATVTSSRIVEVTWDQSLEEDATGYLISYATTASYTSGGSMMVTGRDTTSVTLTNLEENTDYTITVQTNSSGTLSGNSVSVSVATWTDIPSSSPQNVMVASMNPSALRVSWQLPPPIGRNGEIIRYEIEYRRSGEQPNIVPHSGTTHTISGLVPFVMYSVRVAAMTVNGTGPFSDAIEQTSGQDIPTAPRSLMVDSVTGTTVTLSWMTPDRPNGIITQYELRYSRCGIKRYTTLLPLTNEVTRTVTELAVNTEYCFKVRAYTVISLGASEDSSEVKRRTYGPPINVNAVTLSPHSIEVTWDPPVANVDDVTGYIVSYDGIEDFADDDSVSVGRSSTRATIDRLEEFVSYDITVQAVYNTINVSTTSSVRVMTWSDKPGPPRDITLIEADPAMLSVRYRSPEPILRNGDVTGYVIRYTRVGSGVSQMITVDGSSNRFRRDDLPEVEVYTRYSVQLATVNVNGTGSFSDPVMGLSGQDKPTTAPLSLTADTIQSRFVILSWREPATPNGVIVQYEVQYSVNTTASLVNFTDTLMDTVEGLSPGTIYTLQIRAYTRVGAGPFSVGISVTTLLEPPAPVPGVMVPVISSSMLTIYWMEPNVPNGMIVRYTVFYLPVSGPYGPIIISNRRKRQLPQDGEFSVDFTGTSGTLTNLNGSVTYRIQVSAIALHNGTELLGNRSTAEMIATSEGTPTEPHDIVATNVTQSSIFLTWQRPDPPNGLITNYTVSYNAMVTYFNQNTSLMETFTMNNSTSVEPNDDSISASLIFSDLRLGTEYQFTIVAYTNVGPGPEAIMSVSTLPDAPPIPKQPQLPTDAGATTIEITIQRASDFNGPIMYYAVIVVINGDENSTANEKDVGPYNNEGANFAISNSELYTYITGIVETSDISDHPYPYIVGDGMRSSIGGESYVNVQLQSNAMYAILVRAYTTDDLFSTSSSLSVSTASSGGSGDGGGSPGIIIGVIVAISIVAVIVIIIIFVVIYMRHRNGGSAFSGKKSYMEDSSVVALKDMTDHGKSAGSFEPEIIGLPKDLVATEGQSYTFPYHVTGKPAPDVYWYLNSKDMTENDDVVISSNGQLTLTVVRTDHEGEWRCQATSSSGSSEARTNLTVKSTKAKPLPSPRPVHRHKPIPTGEFGVYVNMLHENSNQGFKDEYESFYNGKDMSTAVGSASSNNFKNRFANIVAYDNNRVALVPCGEYKDDYVNASPVDGYQHPKYFIAAQAPVNKTLADFWRLIWQEHPPTIVMVTNLKEGEKVKCVQYWPNAVGESLTFGPLRVQLSEEFEFADYVVRTIELKNAEQRNHLRVVTQYHFTAWPDHGVPEYATAMLAFHRRVRANHHSSIGPMMVHCSAGVGRTGTFITIDIALEQVKAEGVVDIYNIVNKLRHQRPHMVQALEQYMFMHDGILESITCGNTQVSAPDLQRMVAKLKQRDPHTNLTGYEQQFKVLEQVSPRVEEQVSNSALRNPDKNRPNHCPPMEKGRVILRKEKPDYINAAFLKGYKQDKAFIVAQSPMQNTVRDFWKMMMDRQCACVVMLCELEEGGQEACAPYWPDTGSFTYGDIVVANISVVEAKEFTTGVFKVTDKKSNVTHQVTQFHMHSWGAHKSPASNAGILAMIEEIQKVQRGTGNKPIVVHCSNVLGRTGTFCVLFTILDRFKVEQVVDVLQTVKLLRIKRPGIVEDLDQYQFIYSTVLRYLQSFDTYDNFKI